MNKHRIINVYRPLITSLGMKSQKANGNRLMKSIDQKN